MEEAKPLIVNHAETKMKQEESAILAEIASLPNRYGTAQWEIEVSCFAHTYIRSAWDGQIAPAVGFAVRSR